MIEFLQQLVNGLSLGSVIALVALGYTMVYGIIKLINFAHGEIFMIGAYVGYLVMANLPLPFYVSFVIALLAALCFCAIFGVLVEKVAYKPLRKAPRIAALITAIGVSFLLQYLMMFIFGADPKTFPIQELKSYEFSGVVIKEIQIIIIVIAFLLMVALQFIVHKTKIGKAMRAVSVDAEAAQLMGIKPDTTISYTFALGSALAGIAGVLIGIYYNSIDPLMGSAYGTKAFIAAVFGGIGIIPGAMVGGLTIGFTEIFMSGYFSSLLKDGAVYLILILILVIKPTGLLGKKEGEKV